MRGGMGRNAARRREVYSRWGAPLHPACPARVRAAWVPEAPRRTERPERARVYILRADSATPHPHAALHSLSRSPAAMTRRCGAGPPPAPSPRVRARFPRVSLIIAAARTTRPGCARARTLVAPPPRTPPTHIMHACLPTPPHPHAALRSLSRPLLPPSRRCRADPPPPRALASSSLARALPVRRRRFPCVARITATADARMAVRTESGSSASSSNALLVHALEPARRLPMPLPPHTHALPLMHRAAGISNSSGSTPTVEGPHAIRDAGGRRLSGAYTYHARTPTMHQHPLPPIRTLFTSYIG